MAHVSLEQQKRLAYGSSVILAIALRIQERNEHVDALAYISTLLQVTNATVVEEGLITEDDLANCLGYENAAAAEAAVPEVVGSMDAEDAVETMEVFDRLDKRGEARGRS